MTRRCAAALLLLVAPLAATACAGGDNEALSTTSSTAPASTTTTAPTTTTTTTTTTAPTTTTSTTTTVPATTTTTSTTSTTTSTSTTSTTTSTTTTTTTTTTTVPPPPPTAPPAPPIPPVPPIPAIDAFAFPFDTEVEIGRSVENRPITVIRRGTPGGTKVLAVGAIHGNEAAGMAIVDRLAVEPVPEGVELWLVRSMNPDGVARVDRQNANLVDLNRNFPDNWGYLGEPGYWQFGGTGPASEPETRAMIALGDSVRPDLVFWYHQDLFRISPSTGRAGDIRARYATLTGLPLVEVTGGTYTGTASQWARTVITDAGTGITVELGPTLSDDEIAAHTAAVLSVATEFF